MTEEKFKEFMQTLKESKHEGSYIWYYVFSITGKSPFRYITYYPEFGEFYYNFHKQFRQVDINQNLFRLADDHETIEEHCCGFMDGLIWNLIDQTTTPFLHDTLKKLHNELNQPLKLGKNKEQ